MPSNAQIILTPGMLPQGYCWTTPQQFNEDIFEIAQGILPGNFNTFNYGPNKPAPEDQDKPWIRTDNFGNFDRLYTFNGLWVSPNSDPPSTQERRIWVGSEASVWSFDGGDGSDPTATPPTDTTGAMWQVDHAFDFRIPMGAGTNPIAYTPNPATTLTIGQTLGEEKHLTSVNELPAHKHLSPMIVSTGSAGDLNEAWEDLQGSEAYPTTQHCVQVTGSTFSTLVHPYTKNNTTTAVAASVLNPVVGVFIIRRSNRIYYTVP